jgi:hypothetical protein
MHCDFAMPQRNKHASHCDFHPRNETPAPQKEARRQARSLTAPAVFTGDPANRHFMYQFGRARPPTRFRLDQRREIRHMAALIRLVSLLLVGS